MALTYGAVVYNGKRCKIFTVTDTDNAAANDLALNLTTALGLTAFQGAVAGVEWHVVCTASAADAAWLVGVTACTATVCTIRKMVAVGGANAKTFLITLRIPKGIAA